MPDNEAAFLDTTILVDRVLRDHEPTFLDRLSKICDGYSLRLTSTFAKLEFKNVVLMDLQCVAQWVEEEDSWVEAYARATKMRSRRKDTLVNVAAWVQRKLDTSIELQRGDSLDAALKIQAVTYIYNAIEYLWYRFDHEIDSIVDGMKCKRVAEGPERKASGKVAVRNRRSQCLSMTCNNVGVFQSHRRRIRQLVEQLREMESSGHPEMTDELRRIIATYDEVQPNLNRLCNFSKCCGIGDLWIHVEAIQSAATALVTRNYKESRVLCRLLGIDMVNPDDE